MLILSSLRCPIHCFVFLSLSLLCLPVAAGVQAMTVTVIRTAAASNVMRMVCMIFTSSVRTVRYGLANCR